MQKEENNTIIYIQMYDESQNEYECLGVLMGETDSTIRVAFNAHNDVVRDDIIIQKDKIIKFEKLPESAIKVFE
jgi:hypothetical protein